MTLHLYTVTANCGPVIPPANGYINNYTSTLEGVNVTFTCQQNNDSQQTLSAASCNANGNWDPNPFKFCMDTYGN